MSHFRRQLVAQSTSCEVLRSRANLWLLQYSSTTTHKALINMTWFARLFFSFSQSLNVQSHASKAPLLAFQATRPQIQVSECHLPLFLPNSGESKTAYYQYLRNTNHGPKLSTSMIGACTCSSKGYQRNESFEASLMCTPKKGSRRETLLTRESRDAHWRERVGLEWLLHRKHEIRGFQSTFIVGNLGANLSRF